MADTEMALPPIETAKPINVYTNGDDKFPGKRIIINKKKIANFDVFLDHITAALRPRFGAVRRLYTPVAGHRITDLEQVVQHGDAYVAAGQERFQKFSYLEIEVSPRRKFNRTTIDIKPVRHSRIQTSGRIRKIRTEPIIIFVHPNGNDLENPHRIQLRPREQGSWEMVLDAIKERVALRWGGAIRRLCSMDGQPIMNVHEIENSGCYVACGSEGFKVKDYAHPKLTMSSPRQERRSFPFGMKLTPLSNRTSKKGSQNSSVNRTPESHNGSLNRPRKARRTQPRKDEIREKPVAHKRNGRKEVNYDQDPGGMYKAKHENQATRGAQEIQEDRDTRVDVPVDQREAEEVQEERIEDSRSKTNSRSTRNSRASRNKPSRDQKRGDSSDRDNVDTAPVQSERARTPEDDQIIREGTPEVSPRRSPTPPQTYRLEENESEVAPTSTPDNDDDDSQDKEGGLDQV